MRVHSARSTNAHTAWQALPGQRLAFFSEAMVSVKEVNTGRPGDDSMQSVRALTAVRAAARRVTASSAAAGSLDAGL